MNEATTTLTRAALEDVVILQADIHDATFQRPFHCIVAADVLEHFVNLEVPVAKIRSWLAPGGLLFTSLPTENWLYEAIRWLFGLRKPDDHYHKANDIEQFLLARGFEPIIRRSLPVAGFALFSVTSWRKLDDDA